MQIKMTKVLNLNSLYSKIKTKVLPARTAYKISKLFSAIERESGFYSTELNKLIEEYAERDSNGDMVKADNGIQLKEEYIDLMKQKCNDLWNLDIEVPDVNFTIDELDGLDLPIEEFELLFQFINE